MEMGWDMCVRWKGLRWKGASLSTGFAEHLRRAIRLSRLRFFSKLLDTGRSDRCFPSRFENLRPTSTSTSGFPTGPHVLHPCPFIRKVPIAFLTIVMIRAIAVLLDEALVAGKIGVAVIAHPVAVRILRVLLVSSILLEPGLAAIAVRHRILH